MPANIFGEDSSFLKEQLITYIGNKRKLLYTLGSALSNIKKRINKTKLRILDGFAGSGVVSRFFKQHADFLMSNDLEKYSKVIGDCYLANRSEINFDDLHIYYQQVERSAEDFPVKDGFIRRLYAPKDDNNIQPGERVFYSTDNAVRIDSMRCAIDKVPTEFQNFLLAPLLSEASVHANTSGVFKGFYKNENKIGQFGGNNADALKRILGKIELPFPVFSKFECEYEMCNQDTNELVKTMPEVDVAYFDPPYNQHPYGSNYFMLNLIVSNKEPTEISDVSGIAQGWNRSQYNSKPDAFAALSVLVEKTPAKFLLISYNNEGFISRDQFLGILGQFGQVEVIETEYNTFRGSRNLQNRPKHVKEQLYLLERH